MPLTTAPKKGLFGCECWAVRVFLGTFIMVFFRQSESSLSLSLSRASIPSSLFPFLRKEGRSSASLDWPVLGRYLYLTTALR